MNNWNIGAGFDLVQGEWIEDSYSIEKVWFVEATNEHGDRYYWQGVRDEKHALVLEKVGRMQVAQNRFNIRKGQWRLSDNPVYGSQAYVADYHNQEFSRMDEYEQEHARYRMA